MTTDELKKEAREKSASNHNYINHYYVNGYVEGSEPREKRIAELEKENAELKNRNQELLESCEGATMMYEHLTKAKELLKWFVWYFREDYNNVPYKHKVGEAEQFLSEVEK